jgi:hypothetical protein
MNSVGRRSFPEKLPPESMWAASPGLATAETVADTPMQPFVAADADDDVPPAFSSRILWIASVASIVWLALAAAVIYLVGRSQLASLTLTEWAGVAAGVAAPLSAIWLIALVAARVYPGEQRETLRRIEAAEQRFARTAAETRTQLQNIDAILSAVTARVDGLRQVFANEVDGFVSATDAAVERTRTLAANLADDRAAIDGASERLAVAGDRAREQFTALAAELPGAEAHVDRIAEVLRNSGAEAKRQLQETEDLLAAVWSRSEEAGAQARTAADALTGVITAIAASATDAESRLGAYASTLETSADAALAKTGEALEATRLGVEAQTSALAAAIARTSLDLDDIGGRAVETIAARIDSIAGHVATLGAELQHQDGRSQNLLDTIERGFSVLDAKLANAAQSSDSILASLSARMLQVRGEIDALSAPLDGTRVVARDLGGAIAAVREATQAALAELADGVPEGAERGIGAIDALRGSVANLSQDVDRLNARAAALGEPINSGRRAVDELLDGLEDQRESLEVAVAKVRGELETAQTMIAGIERSTESTALGATTQLIEALGRVREVAVQTAGTVKAALDNVVAEARESLAKASRDAVRESMHAPVEAQIKALEAASERGAEAAQAAAERLSRQLVSVAETAAAIEARVTAADAHLDEAQRTDLGHQSELLIEALNSASIDIAKGLSAEVTEAAWKAYLAGDRGIFGRKAVQLLSRGDNREVARRYGEDGEFRDAVRRYIHDFEAMMRRVGADREAGALSMTLLSSDIGKLYVALAQATDRLR